MKLAMRLPEKNAAANADPRDDATTEVIDLASRTSYPAVANRKGGRDALGLMAGVGFVALLGAATLWGLNASRVSNEEAAAAGAAEAAPPPPAPANLATSPTDGLPSANAGVAPQPDPAPAAVLARAPDASNAVGTMANPYSSPTLVFDGGVAPATAAANAAAAEAAAAATSGPAASAVPGSGAANEFAARIGGVGGGPALAVQNVNPTTTVTQYTISKVS